jgi:hypothetical protein
LRSADRTDLLAGTVLLLYAAAGCSMILLTRYRFAVDPINPRFVIQYHWAFVAGCILAGAYVLREVPVDARRLRAVAATAVALLLLAPQVRLAKTQMAHMEWSRMIAKEHAGLRDTITELPDDVCIAAFHAPQLHLMYGRQVYQMPPAVSPAKASEFVGDRPLVVVVFPYEYDQFREWWTVFDGELPDGYREIARSGGVIALERPRREPQP